MQESNGNLFSVMWRQKLINYFFLDKIAQNTVPLLLFRAKVLKISPLEKNFDFLKDLNSTNPTSVYGVYELSNSVMIRSIG